VTRPIGPVKSPVAINWRSVRRFMAPTERHAISAALLPEPVAMTTNCLPAFVRYVIGVEDARRVRSADHTSSPVFLSNA
jgi:hypothetical protein